MPGWGSFPVVWSEKPDRRGQIWGGLGLLSIALLLLWSESGRRTSSNAPFNKTVGLRWRLWPSPLAGHGGEGRRAGLLPLQHAQGSSSGLSPVLASGAGFLSVQSPYRFLWWEIVGGAAVGGGPFNNLQARAGSRIRSILASPSLQAGRGGREKGVPVMVYCAEWIRAGLHLAGELCPPLFPSADGGGVGEFGGRFCPPSARRWMGMFLEIPPAGDVNFRGKELFNSLCYAASLDQIFNNPHCKMSESVVVIGLTGHCESSPYCWKCCQIFGSVPANTHLRVVLNPFLCGFIVTLLTPVSFGHQSRRNRACCLLISREMIVLQLQSGCHTFGYLQAAGHSVFAFFVPLGCIRRRQMREFPMSLPRFSGEEFSVLGSVKLPSNLQLNPKPQRCLPTRLLVEPLALRLVRLQEAPGEDNCRFFLSEFSSDPLAGSICLLRHRQFALLVAFCYCVHLGTCFISVFESTYCKFYIVLVLYF